jgi:hypothetical protein
VSVSSSAAPLEQLQIDIYYVDIYLLWGRGDVDHQDFRFVGKTNPAI